MPELSPFQQMVQDDFDGVFLNPDEFGEIHIIENAETVCVIDTDDHLELSGGQKLGLSRGSIRVFAKVTDLPHRREEGGSLNVDGREYIVESWAEDMGMATVVLSQTRSM